MNFYYRNGFRRLLYVYVSNFRRIESILNHLGFRFQTRPVQKMRKFYCRKWIQKGPIRLCFKFQTNQINIRPYGVQISNPSRSENGKFYYRIGFRTVLYVYVLNFRKIESILNHLGFRFQTRPVRRPVRKNLCAESVDLFGVVYVYDSTRG